MFMVKRLISMHPKLAAVLDGVFSLFLLWSLRGVHYPWMLWVWFGVRIVWWAVLTQFVYYPPYLSRVRHAVSLTIFNLGIISFLVFSDPSVLNYSRILFFGLPLVSFWLIPARKDSLSVMLKPHRRWKFFMSLFGVAGLWLAFEAGIEFQIVSGSSALFGIFAAALVTALISSWEWNEYGIAFSPKFFQLAGIMFLLFAQLGTVVFLWPVGYFVSAFFITWVWYLTWLLFRFDLTEGIRWSHQKYFVATNLILMIVFLVSVVRWK